MGQFYFRIVKFLNKFHLLFTNFQPFVTYYFNLSNCRLNSLVNLIKVGISDLSKVYQYLLYYRQKKLLKSFLSYNFCYYRELLQGNPVMVLVEPDTVMVLQGQVYFHRFWHSRMANKYPNYPAYIGILKILIVFLHSIHRTLQYLLNNTHLSAIVDRIYRRDIPFFSHPNQKVLVKVQVQVIFLDIKPHSKIHNNPSCQCNGKHRIHLVQVLCKHCKACCHFGTRSYFFLLSSHIIHRYNFLQLQPAHMFDNNPICLDCTCKLNFLYLFHDGKRRIPNYPI